MKTTDFNFPKCKEQKDFEDLAFNLIKVLANLEISKVMDVFEYAQNVAFNEKHNNK